MIIASLPDILEDPILANAHLFVALSFWQSITTISQTPSSKRMFSRVYQVDFGWKHKKHIFFEKEYREYFFKRPNMKNLVITN